MYGMSVAAKERILAVRFRQSGHISEKLSGIRVD